MKSVLRTGCGRKNAARFFGEIIDIVLVNEEAVSKKGEVFNRAYQLKDIKKIADVFKSVLVDNDGLTQDTSATIKSVADLYNLVKTYSI